MGTKGWVGLWRGMADSQMWLAEPFTFGQAWTDLMMLAAWEDEEALGLRAGDVCETVRGLAARWQWNRYRTEKFLHDLAGRGWIRLYAAVGLHGREPAGGWTAPMGFEGSEEAGRPMALLRIVTDEDGLMAEMSRVFGWEKRKEVFSPECGRNSAGDAARVQPAEGVENKGEDEEDAAGVWPEMRPDFSQDFAEERPETENGAKVDAWEEEDEPKCGRISARRSERFQPDGGLENKGIGGCEHNVIRPDFGQNSAGKQKNAPGRSSPPLSSPLKGGKEREESGRSVPPEYADRFTSWEEYIEWRFQ